MIDEVRQSARRPLMKSVFRTFKFLGGRVERPDGRLNEFVLGTKLSRKGTGLG